MLTSAVAAPGIPIRPAGRCGCVPPVPQRPNVYGRASRSELALTADRLSAPYAGRDIRPTLERLPERLVEAPAEQRHALALASSRLEHQGQ
ncbi:MAG: hypothetical protein ACLU0O_12500 [Collinsella sp.]